MNSSFPLQPLVASLAIEGIRLTIRDYERIQLVLQTRGVWTFERLRDTLITLLLVVLLLVTRTVTLPVGAELYVPDPALTAWNAEHKRQRKDGVPKQDRPAKPKKKVRYPTKLEIAVSVLSAFQAAFPALVIQGVIADALYGSNVFVNPASSMCGGIQVITQLRQNQTVRFRGTLMSLTTFFTRSAGVSHTIRIRGGHEGGGDLCGLRPGAESERRRTGRHRRDDRWQRPKTRAWPGTPCRHAVVLDQRQRRA